MTNANTELKSASLYFTNGSSDKEYHANIEASGDGYTVNFRYGRRGTSLTTGTKTQTPVDYDKAVAIFDKLVKEKSSKGYTAGEDGTPYLHSDKAVSGLLPQLLNVIDDREVSSLIDNPAWCMQEKFDGRRMMLRKVGETVEAINKLGLVVGLSAPIAEAAMAIPGDFTLDGEVIGDRYFIFDQLSHDGTDLTGKSYRDRYSSLVSLLGSGGGALIVAQCWTTDDKSVELAALKERNAEGAVFKHLDASYAAGRPASGGTQLKLKFVATLSAVVTKVNDKRSVAVSLLDGDAWKPMGNVTVPANQDIPTEGTVVEVRYLYAIPGGSLFQPTLLGVRDDIETKECVVAQLKFKAEGEGT
jgi:bifunctional non-homologous end joining protein LigD